MRRILIGLAVFIAVFAAAASLFWFGARGGWWGVEHGTGEIAGTEVPANIIQSRTSSIKAFAPESDDSQILFGDLHVHTTLSVDAYQFSLPLLGGKGLHPLADACDFARYCSAVDFWASTDHAESLTQLRWSRIKDSVRACQKVAGDQTSPDLVSFIGFEWTQVGPTPDAHFGHKNVIFEGLEDKDVAARAIGAVGKNAGTIKRLANPMSPAVVIADFKNRQQYYDYNRFLSIIRDAPECDRATASDKLSKECLEKAATPGELVRKLVDEQKLKPLIIPHGTSWGFYTPAGTTWNKALAADERPDQFKLVEVYSGHGNSEEYRSWDEVSIDSQGKRTCPKPAPGYTPSCWRAGEIISDRCLKAGVDAKICDERAATARQNYIDMGIAGHLTVPAVKPENWLDGGQCTDCFLPAFNYRPKSSVQAGLAETNFGAAGDSRNRFHWGFIGSSDNHRARPGTGYKPVDRRENTEAAGPSNEQWRQVIAVADTDEIPEPRLYSADELAKLPGLQTSEAERQATFLHTGGLAAVHASSRSREAIWDALQRRETYATSGQKILLWFHALDQAGKKVPMGSRLSTKVSPKFEVKAVGSFKQKPGCPAFAEAGLDKERIKNICSGECDNPSDTRSRITRIEVVKITPQKSADEKLSNLIQDRYIVHQCPASADGSCSFTFEDKDYAKSGRDALYYVKAIQEPEEMINAEPLKCERDANGKCIKVNLCYGDYRSGADNCTAPAEPRAWSSPVYLDYF